jgi:hypothetical protein
MLKSRLILARVKTGSRFGLDGLRGMGMLGFDCPENASKRASCGFRCYTFQGEITYAAPGANN